MPELRPKAWETATRFGILLGLLAMLVGLAVFVVTDPDRFWKSLPVVLPLGLGFLCSAVCFVLNYNWLADVILRRRTLVGVNVAFMVAFALGILVVLNLINVRHYKRWDLTQQKRFALSSQTLNVLKGLKKNVKITALYGQNAMLRDRVPDLLAEYKAHSPRVEIEQIDALRDTERLKMFLTTLKTKPDEADSVVFQCGERIKVVNQSDMLEYPPFMGWHQPQQPPSFKGEAAFTEAILSVSEEKQTTIYFVSGHGERDTENFRGDGLSHLVTMFKRNNWKVEKLNLPQQKTIPEDCDVLIIPGPKAEFEQAEIDVLRDYLRERNGKLIVMFEPRVTGGVAGALGRMLEDYNVRVHDELVTVVPHRGLLAAFESPLRAYGVEYGNHPVSKALANLNTVFSVSCPLEAIESGSGPESSGPGNPGFRAVALVKTGDRAWGEKHIPEHGTVGYDPAEDLKGPITLAVAVQPQSPKSHPYAPPPPESEARGARLIVFGDADFVCNNTLEGSPGNQTLITSAVSWAAQKESQIGIPPKMPEMRRITITAKQKKAVFAIVLFAIPLGFVLFGGVVWWRRRR